MALLKLMRGVLMGGPAGFPSHPQNLPDSLAWPRCWR